jgi:hypothetical protein
MKKTDYFREASNFYLCNPLPEDYNDMTDEQLYTFLEENAWEPFEYWLGEKLEGEIYSLECAMERIAKDAIASVTTNQ